MADAAGRSPAARSTTARACTAGHASASPPRPVTCPRRTSARSRVISLQELLDGQPARLLPDGQQDADRRASSTKTFEGANREAEAEDAQELADWFVQQVRLSTSSPDSLTG